MYKRVVSTRGGQDLGFFFSSHDDIHHVRVAWDGHPLLLFSDPSVVKPCNTCDFRQQHLQMGLRKGMAILLYYAVGGRQYQAVLIAQDSALGKAKKSEHRLWRRVAPITIEFAWLPPDVAWSFCSAALYREACREYVAFTEPHMQLAGRAFEAGVVVEDMYYLGDTRSADDLVVFTQMDPARLCLGCGLRVDEPFAALTAGERPKLLRLLVSYLP